MYGMNVQKMHDQYGLCMETTNLHLNDKRRASDQVQIDTNSVYSAPIAQSHHLQGGNPLANRSLPNGNLSGNPSNTQQCNLQNNAQSNLQGNLQNNLQSNLQNGNLPNGQQTNNLQSNLANNQHCNQQGHLQSNQQGNQASNLPYTQTSGNYLADYNFNELRSANLGDINANLANGNSNCNTSGNPNGNPNGNLNGDPNGNLNGNLMSGNINSNLNSGNIGNHLNNGCGEMNSNPTLTNGNPINNGDLNADSYSPTPVFINLDQPQQFPAKQIKQETVQNDSYPDGMNMSSQYPDKEFSQSNRDTQASDGSQANRNSPSVSKICRVCGDKSLGYNFSQVTCESCKAFFRRNALRNKQFKCPFTDNCEIDVITRRFCQKCRLKRCFEIGMKSEWILSDEEKRLKRLKIEENKRKRRNRQLQTGYLPTSPYSTGMDGSYLNGSVPSNASSNSLGVASPLMLPNGQIANNNSLNSMMYDSQIEDSSIGMGSGFVVQPAPTFHNQFDRDRNPVNSSSYFNSYSSNTEQVQQPEIVNRLVQSHYEQYKLGSDDLNNWDQSPEQYSNSLGSTPGRMDQFFSDQSTASPATLSSSLLSSVDSPFNIASVVSNNLQSEAAMEQSQQNQQSAQNYSADQNMENSDQARDVKPSITMLNASRMMTVSCLSDAQMIDEIFEQAIAFKLNPPCKSTCSSNSGAALDTFSSGELEIINELLRSCTNVGCVMNALSNQESIPTESVIFEILRMTDYSVRKSIKVAKKISFFRNLCEDDQISALKGGSTEMMLCRTIQLYDEETDMMIKREMPFGARKMKLEVLKGIREELYVEHKEMILSFEKRLRQDSTLVSLLMAILLFEPNRPNIQHRTTMKYCQTIYRYLIKRYIYINFDKNNLPIFDKLMQNLQKLRALNAHFLRIYLELNSAIFTPLLVEVFDFGC